MPLRPSNVEHELLRRGWQWEDQPLGRLRYAGGAAPRSPPEALLRNSQP